MRISGFGLLLLLAVSCRATADDDWQQWRGPGRNGVVSGQPWPARLSDSALRRQWSVELGPGYSGPLVSEDRVYVTETREKKDEVVRALDRRTGKEIWSVSWPGAMTVPFFAASNGSWIRSTPTLDGNDLFVAGMRDVLVCLDIETGKERWRVDFVEKLEAPLPSFGCVCSPLVDGDAVYLQAAAAFVKLDRETGRVIWRTLEDGGGMSGSAFSSPVIAVLGGVRQAVVQTREKLAGVDLESGDVLWSTSVEAFRGMNILTPTVIENRIFTSTYGGGSYLFQVTGTATEGFEVAQVWRNKVQGYMSSPVVIDGHVYLHLRNQRFACIDLQSGKERWISQPFGKYWSLIAQDRQILALDEKGELLLIAASPDELRILDRFEVTKQPAWAHLALAGQDIVIRDQSSVLVLQIQ
jgi:outer membrane protein assembly factor BamB